MHVVDLTEENRLLTKEIGLCVASIQVLDELREEIEKLREAGRDGDADKIKPVCGELVKNIIQAARNINRNGSQVESVRKNIAKLRKLHGC